MTKLLRYIPFAYLAMPVFVLAAQANFDYLDNLGSQVLEFINGILVPLVFALAALVFFWGVFNYFILGASNEDKRAAGQKLMLYGITGLVVMVAIWGIVNLVLTLFGITAQQNVQVVPNAPLQR